MLRSADNYVTSNFSSAARCTCCGSWSGVVWPAVGFDECRRRRRRGDAQTARTTHTRCTHTHTRSHTHSRTHTPKTYSYANSALVFSAHLSPLRPHPPLSGLSCGFCGQLRVEPTTNIQLKLFDVPIHPEEGGRQRGEAGCMWAGQVSVK